MNKFKSLVFITIIIITSLCSAANTQLLAQETNDIDDMYNYYAEDNNNGCKRVYDPYEKLNRKIFAFNTVLDDKIFRPIAIGYGKVTNDYVRTRIKSFITNVDTPLTATNYALQLNYNKTMENIWRFIINTTLGVGGLFDVASKVGIKAQRQTFGNTLAHYGAAPGPYLMLPILGGTSMRDVTDSLFTNYTLNPIMYYVDTEFKLCITVTDKIHSRYSVLPFTDYVTKNAIDPYITVRNTLHQTREASVQYPPNFKCPVRKSKSKK